MNSRGFTLLEAMVALVILGLVAVGYIELFGVSTRTTRQAEEWLQAVAYAENGMESAKLDLEEALARGRESLPGGFSRYVQRSSWSPGLMQVTVTVTFPRDGAFSVTRIMEGRP